MEILILFAVATIALWCVVLLGFWQATSLKSLRYLPLGCVGIILCGCIFGHDFFHLQVGFFPLTIDRAFLLLLLGCFGIQIFHGRERFRRFNLADATVLLTIGILGLNVIGNDWSYKQNLPISRLLFFFLLPVSLYFVIRSVRISSRELQLIGWAFTGLAVYLAFTAIAETREWTYLVFPKYIMLPGEFYGRGRGPLLNPVINGMLMVAGCCCLWMHWPKSSAKARLLIGCLTLMIAGGIFCTYTRSVWLGFLASAAVFVFYPAPRKTKGLLWIASITLLVVTFPVFGEKVFSFKRDKSVTQAEMELSAKLRPIFVEVAWKMFRDRPLWGCGFGHYAREKYPYLKSADASQPLTMTKRYMQHNVFLAFLTETGLIGLGGLLAILVVIAMAGWKLWQDQNQDSLTRCFGLLLIAALLNYSINGMFHDVSIIPLSNLLLLFLWGLVNNLNTAKAAETDLYPAIPTTILRQLMPFGIQETCSPTAS
jgi:O-antigen ligase